MKDTSTTTAGHVRARRQPEDKDAATLVAEIAKSTRKSRRGLTALIGRVVMGGGNSVKVEELRELVEEAEAFVEQTRRVGATITAHLGKPTGTTPAAAGK